MRHFSCDLCGKTLAPGEDTRYVVRVEGFAAVDPADAADADTDSDSVDSMDELLAELEEKSQAEHDTVEMPPLSAKIEYDLCGGCYGKLLSDPLGLQARRKMPVSRN